MAAILVMVLLMGAVAETISEGIDNQLEAYIDGLDYETTYEAFYVTPNAPMELKVKVNAVDLSGITYQWTRSSYDHESGYWDHKDLDNDTDTYTIDAATSRGMYSCTVRDQYGNLRGVTFDVYIENHLEAYVDGVSYQTNSRNFNVASGESVEMKVRTEADDLNGITYQWYGQTFDPVTGSWQGQEQIEGATGSILTVPNATGLGDYYCQVLDPYGNEADVWFYIRIENGFSAYAAEEGNVYVEPNASVALEVVAECASGELHYRWNKDWESVEGAADSTLTIENITENTVCECYVWDDYGNNREFYFYIYIDQSNTVNSTPIAVGESLTASISEAGETAYFSFTPENSDYYYFYSSSDGYLDTYGTAYDAALNIQDEDDERAGNGHFRVGSWMEAGKKYLLAARFSDEEETGSFQVHLDTSLRISAQETPVFAHLGEEATMRVAASGMGSDQLQYQWYQDGEAISGATASALTVIHGYAFEDYFCRVTDPDGYTRTIRFRIYTTNGFNAYALDDESEFHVMPGDSVTLAIDAYCNQGEIYCQWYQMSNEGDIQLEGETDYTLTVDNVTEDAAYYCLVTYEYGNDEIRVDFQVYCEEEEEQSDITLSIFPENPALGGEVTIEWEIDCAEFAGGELHINLHSWEMVKEYDCFIMTTRTGSKRFTLSEGDEMSAYAYVYIGEGLEGFGKTFGPFELQGDWDAPNPIQADVIYDSVNVQTGDTITANYQISGGSGEFDSIYAWWAKAAENGDEVLMYGMTLENTSGSVSYVPITAGEYGLIFAVNDENGWRFSQKLSNLSSHVTVTGSDIEETLTAEAAGKTYFPIPSDGTATMEVSASCDHGNIYYFWYYSESMEGEFNEIGSGSASYTTGEGGYYFCCVDDEYGNEKLIWFTVRTYELPEGKTLKLPAYLTEIESEAFANTAAEAVIIPRTVKSIDGNPFAGSSVLYVFGSEGTAAETLANEYEYTFVAADDEWMSRHP